MGPIVTKDVGNDADCTEGQEEEVEAQEEFDILRHVVAERAQRDCHAVEGEGPTIQQKSTYVSDPAGSVTPKPDAVTNKVRDTSGQKTLASVGLPRTPQSAPTPPSLPGAYAEAPSNSEEMIARLGQEPQSPEAISTALEVGLAVANEVDDSRMPLAQEMENSGHEEEKRELETTALVAVLICVVLLGVGLLLILLFRFPRRGDTPPPTQGSHSSSQDRTPVPTQGSTLSPPDQVLSFFPTDTRLALQDPTSPQTRAYEWLSKDPYLANYTMDRAVQRYALAVLYHSTNGALWTHHQHWLNYDVHECLWYGGSMFFVFLASEFSDYPCHNQAGLYERLWLGNNNLDGTVPEEVYALTNLISMEMQYNPNLTATISPRLQQLTQLQKISFSSSDLRGTVPTEIGLLSHLKVLYLRPEEGTSNGKLNGTIPEQLGHITGLEQLALGYNHLSGTVPTELGSMPNMTIISIQDNPQLTGTLPSEIGQLSQLWLLFVYSCGLTGAIPSQLGLLEDLHSIHGFNNHFQGTIPSELGGATNLKELLLANNTLEGSIPSQLGQLKDTYMVFLSNNQGLNGTLPLELEQLSFKLQAFDISNTSITGEVPLFLQEAQNYTSFDRYYFKCDKKFPCPDDKH